MFFIVSKGDKDQTRHDPQICSRIEEYIDSERSEDKKEKLLMLILMVIWLDGSNNYAYQNTHKRTSLSALPHMSSVLWYESVCSKLGLGTAWAQLENNRSWAAQGLVYLRPFPLLLLRTVYLFIAARKEGQLFIARDFYSKIEPFSRFFTSIEFILIFLFLELKIHDFSFAFDYSLRPHFKQYFQLHTSL